MPCEIIPILPAGQYDIGLGLAITQSQWILRTDVPSGTMEHRFERRLDGSENKSVQRTLGHMEYQHPFNEFNRIVVRQHSGSYHFMILLHRKREDRLGRVNRLNLGGRNCSHNLVSFASQYSMTRLRIMRDFLHKLIHRQHLSRAEAKAAFEAILSGGATDAQIAGLLVGLSTKGVVLDELVGAHGVMREHVLPVPRGDDEVILDTCGTGGDVKGTFNISTAAALLAAACGVKVVKHGNRSASSKSGSADVLEKLGVRLDVPADKLRACLDHAGICFAFARNHHPAMKHVAAARTALGVPTIFNLLGPLTNPARAHYQLLGVYSQHLTELLAGVLKESGSKRAWVVHAEDGLDELSTLGPTHVCELNNGSLKTWTLDPNSLGLAKPKIDDLQVDSVEASAAAIVRIMDGQPGPMRDIAGLNAAAGMVITGAASDLAEGLHKVDRAVLSGAARNTLAKLVEFS